MIDYLEAVDDSLAMRPSGPWAAKKLDYLERYIDAFEKSMREKWHVRNYIDLLSGPGKVRVRNTGRILLGSPLVALTTTFPFTGYYYADLDETKTRALEQRCAASPLYDRVHIRTGDCNQLVGGVVRELQQDAPRSLNLAFIDPEGPSDVRWETVAALGSLPRVDLIVLYPQYGLSRNLKQCFQGDGETAVDRFFGGGEWRAIYEDFARGRLTGTLHPHLVGLYKDKLEGLGYWVERGYEPLIRNLERGAPLYRLVFASKHRLGQKFWRSILEKDADGQRRLL